MYSSFDENIQRLNKRKVKYRGLVMINLSLWKHWGMLVMLMSLGTQRKRVPANISLKYLFPNLKPKKGRNFYVFVDSPHSSSKIYNLWGIGNFPQAHHSLLRIKQDRLPAPQLPPPPPASSKKRKTFWCARWKRKTFGCATHIQMFSFFSLHIEMFSFLLIFPKIYRRSIFEALFEWRWPY